MNLSTEQQKAINTIIDWYKTENKKSQFITLGGYAGTGKTTLLAAIRNILHKEKPDLQVSFCSYTGKATRVLGKKLKDANSIYFQDHVSTIHSLIYSPMVDDKERIIGWEKKDELTDVDLLIVDESSMLNKEIFLDLLKYKKPIIFAGDHGQLPPIEGSFNLMEKPQIVLSQIHRQAENNPIIKFSIHAREEGKVPIESHNFGAVKKLNSRGDDISSEIESLLEAYDENTLVLCGYNNTRIKLNNYIRKLRGIHEPEPQTGDRVICLRNNHSIPIFNGMLGEIDSIYSLDEKWFFAEIKVDDESDRFKGMILKDQFNSPSLNFTDKRSETMNGELFDFGYALTVHKAQGSEAENVILFEEKFKNMSDEMWRRWLYTGITRARSRLTVIGS